MTESDAGNGPEVVEHTPIIPDDMATKLLALNVEFRKAKVDESSAKEAHSAATRRTKSLAEQVSMLLDQIERGPGPLFDDDAVTVAEFAWRHQRLDELTNPPIPPGALKALSEHGTGIVTMGDLADFSKPSGDYLPALTDIKGIGPAAAGKIEAASMGFHESRLEDEKESPDDTDTPPDEDDDEPQGQEQREQQDEQDEQDEQDDDDPDDPDADDAF